MEEHAPEDWHLDQCVPSNGSDHHPVRLIHGYYTITNCSDWSTSTSDAPAEISTLTGVNSLQALLCLSWINYNNVTYAGRYIDDLLLKYQLHWVGYVTRMEDHHLPKIVLHGKFFCVYLTSICASGLASAPIVKIGVTPSIGLRFWKKLWECSRK